MMQGFISAHGTAKTIMTFGQELPKRKENTNQILNN
jgi:hypothetical protein